MSSQEEELKSELNLVDQGLTILPREVALEHAEDIEKLDLTDNKIESFDNFDEFPKLNTLVLDSNNLTSLEGMPRIKTLTTLWLNKNNFSDLDALLDIISKKFPRLNYLSMLMNPCCPNVYASDANVEAYQRYRYRLIFRLRNIEYIDASPVTAQEKKDAATKGQFRTAKPVARSKAASVASSNTERKKQSSPRSQSERTGRRGSGAKSSSFLVRGKPRYDGSNSEGNRFICNDDL